MGEDGKGCMVYAFNRTMEKTQLNYSVTDKELLAVVRSMEFFRRYLIGKNYILRTDHQALTFIHSNKQKSKRKIITVEFKITRIRFCTRIRKRRKERRRWAEQIHNT
jgi:hypothetical protein